MTPYVTLDTGARMPAIGLGTFGSDKYTPAQVAQAVRGAVAGGYRFIDCAAVYGNEREVGEALADAIREGAVRREELFITSKVWNDMHAYDDVIASCKQSLQDLQLDYLDLLLVHWPFPNHHPQGAPPDYHSPDARPYIHEAYMRTWSAMEALYDMGLARAIGVSNMTRAKLELVLRDARVRPAVNELELHPTLQQRDLLKYLKAEGIVPVAFCPLGSPSRPERDRTEEDAVDMEHPVVVEIARELGCHPAAVCLKWAWQMGAPPIPFSVKPEQYAANLRALEEAPLADAQMKRLESVDCGSRLIKGQVFLWREGLDWRALWDEDGVIAS